MKVSVRRLLSIMCAFVLALILTTGMTGTGFADDSYDETDNESEAVASVTIGETTTKHKTLKGAMGKAKGASNVVTVEILKDITLSDGWTSVTGLKNNITINGNAHYITGLNQPLFYQPVKDVSINDLTIKDSIINDGSQNQGRGAFLSYMDNGSSTNLTLTNCHLKNSSVISTTNDIKVGGLYGYSSSTGNITIHKCSVTDCTIKGIDGVGALVGHALGGDASTKLIISKTEAKGNTIETTDEEANTKKKEGILIGSIGTGKIYIEATESANTLAHNGGHVIGRIGSDGATGIFTAGGSYTVNPLEIYYNSTGSITAQAGYKALQRPDGTWTIAKDQITVTAKDQTIDYGSSISKTTSNVTLDPSDGLTLLSITLTPSSTDATQDGTITPSNAEIKSGDETINDESTDYVITYKAGKLIINKVPSSVAAAPKAKELYYTGKAQELITAGESTGGVMYYAIGDNNTTAPNFESTSIPTAINTGSYYVWYKVIGDKNHTDTTPAYVTAKISEALPKISDASITVTQGQSKTLEISDSTGSGTRTWTLNSDAPEWVKLAKNSDSKATLTVNPSSSVNAGSYSCSVTVSNSDNKTSTAKISITVGAAPSSSETPSTAGDYLDNLSDQEKANMTELNLTDEQKSNLTDSEVSRIIDELPALEKLDLSNSKNITKVDAKASENLTSVNLEGCEKLSNVNLGGCTSLSEIKGLSNNKTLQTLDTSGCSSLESLDVSGCTGLTSLDCSGSSLGVLTVGGCTSLVNLDCRNNKLESLTVDNCGALETLECGSNGMSALSLKGCLNLQKLYCYSNNLESLEVPSQKLEWLVCDDNKLSKLDVSENKKLKRLDCQNNSMSALDIDTNIFTSLEWLKCYGQKIANLIVSASGSSYNVNLGEYLKSNAAFMSGKSARVTSSTSNIQSVKGYDKDGNEIELISYDSLTGEALFASSPAKVLYEYKTGYENLIMDVSIGETSSENNETQTQDTMNSGGSSGGCNSGFSLLGVIALAGVFVKRKNVVLAVLIVLAMSVPAFCDVAVNSDNFPDKNFRAYISSDIDINQDGTLSSAEIESVTMIEVYDREIENLAGIEYFTSLQELYCYGNKIQSLNVSRNRELLLLECDNNKITRLDVSNNDKLINLECEMNNITELDLSQHETLNYMKCYGQTRTGLVSSQDEGGLTYTVNLGEYVSDFTRIVNVTAYDGSGEVINSVSFDYETGIASMSSSPSKLRYIYDVNYVKDSGLSMDVTITGTAATQNKSANTGSIGSSSGGCNLGVSIFALGAVSLLMLMRRK